LASPADTAVSAACYVRYIANSANAEWQLVSISTGSDATLRVYIWRQLRRLEMMLTRPALGRMSTRIIGIWAIVWGITLIVLGVQLRKAANTTEASTRATTAAQQRLYQLRRQPGIITDRTFEITFLASGVEAYVFTFG
jgi:Thioredoxin like C-terminal domain